MQVEGELEAINADPSQDSIQTRIRSPLSRDWENAIRASLPEDVRNVDPFPAHRISPSLVAKRPTVSERESMEFVRRHTTIPVPRVFSNDAELLFMQLVEAQTLLACWDTLPWFLQLRIACTLRMYLKEMRALKRSYPGNIVDGRIDGIFFTDNSRSKFGRCQSPDDLRRICTYAAYLAWSRRPHFENSTSASPPDPEFDWSPVFVHGDLSMTNILLDRNGTVWLIDWGWAGFYPACLEALAMRHSNLIALGDVVPRSWDRYRTFIAGSTNGSMVKFWYNVRASVHHI